MSLAGLFDEQNFEVPDLRVTGSPPQTLSQAAAQEAQETDASSAQPDLAARGEAAPEPALVSKRDFLRGRWRKDAPCAADRGPLGARARSAKGAA
jgi:hypothetical protein